MEEQEDKMDFQALRAKFQQTELIMGPPRTKPALPEKPKVVPPPQSPTHQMPAGARPSLLSTINQALESKNVNAPRVVFKDEKDTKKLQINSGTKTKEKSNGKPKESKDKSAKQSKEKQSEASANHKEKSGKDKKLQLLGSHKETTAEPEEAAPSPKATTQRKKITLAFKKNSKKDSIVITPDPGPGPPNAEESAQLIAVHHDAPKEPEISAPKALPPKLILPEPTDELDFALGSPIPEPPDFSPPPAIIPGFLSTNALPPQSETPLEVENPVLPQPASSSRNTEASVPKPALPPSPPPSKVSDLKPVVVPTPQPRSHPGTLAQPPPTFGNLEPNSANFGSSPPPPDPLVAAAIELDAETTDAQEEAASPSIRGSVKTERPLSAVSVQSTTEDLTPPFCQRTLGALENTPEQAISPVLNPTRPYSITPPTEDFPSRLSPAPDALDCPTFDYKAEKAQSPKPERVNGIDHMKQSPFVDSMTEDKSDAASEPIQDPETLDPALDEPPSVALDGFIPPPPLLEDILFPAESSEAKEASEFDVMALDARCPELPVSESRNEESPGPEEAEEMTQPESLSNGTAVPAPENHSELVGGNKESPLPEPSLAVPPKQDTTDNRSSVHDNGENMYEDVNVASNKKKGKSHNGKKRKGTLKNPYMESTPDPNSNTSQEKSKSSRFGRSEKKAHGEGPDEKELKKKEKQRLEKEKKEQKEKQEREKKEQKEREKKENEMKKKFKVTGQEEPLYDARVKETTKGRKNELSVKSGDIISIIRATNCPKGKWLARDSDNKYGYVSVEKVELDLEKMLEEGKKAARSSALIDTEGASVDGRASSHFPTPGESFTEDSDEWSCDDEEPPSHEPDTQGFFPIGGHTRTGSMPDMGNRGLTVNHHHSHSDMCDNAQAHAKQEAVQKLATFLSSQKPAEPSPRSPEPETSMTPTPEEEEVGEQRPEEEKEFDPTALILPPPDQYADMTAEPSLYSEPTRNNPC